MTPDRTHRAIAWLKQRIKILASTAQELRCNEYNTKDDQERCALHRQRIYVIGTEARVSLLAYAYLRNVPYKDVERHTRIPVIQSWGIPSGYFLWDVLRPAQAMVDDQWSVKQKPGQDLTPEFAAWVSRLCQHTAR